MEEEWRKVVGYEGLYEVSDLGRVKRSGNNKAKKEKLIKTTISPHGYLRVSLYKDGRGKTHLVHRLVAMAFVHNPENLPLVNHKDENKLNSRAENLEWCTYKYNNNYGTVIERRSKAIVQIDICTGNIIKRFISSAEAERELNINAVSIHKCCYGYYKSAGGFGWKFAK